MKRMKAFARGSLRLLGNWSGLHRGRPEETADPDRVDWGRAIPFLLLHLSCLGVLFVGVSPVALLVAVGLYGLRMFAITAFYHRYFSHRAFRTTRVMQFLFALIGAMSVQRGPLWWAAHHRHHHRHSDRESDSHSPRWGGFLHSHMGWFLNRRNYRTRTELVGDLARYPELRFLDRFDILPPAALALALWITGDWLGQAYPALGTSGAQLFFWGFSLSTVVLYHATFTINSLAHSFGRRRFQTRDDSRNNLWLALLTFGEGWHNNHHHYPGSARQGFYWWEIDLSWYLLRGMALVGLVRDLRPVPARVLRAGRGKAGEGRS